MPPIEQSRFIPNELIFQLIYKHNPRVLDIRGELTARLCEAFSLLEFGIDDNTVRVFDVAKSRSAIVGWRNCSLLQSDCTSAAQFKDECQKLLDVMQHFTAFKGDVFVDRIAVRSKFYTEYKGTFHSLMTKLRGKVIDLKPAALAALGDDLTVKDIGAPIDFSTEHGTIKFHMGPEEGKQAGQRYFSRKDTNDFPEVGLYVDLDYFWFGQGTRKEMTWTQVMTEVSRFAKFGWDSHQEIRRAVVS